MISIFNDKDYKELWELINDSGYKIEEILNETESINKTDFGKCHEWRNYIPDGFLECWGHLDQLTKIAIYIMAEKQADAEEWD